MVYNPDLVTREQFDRMQDEYRKRIADLRALPERTGANLRPIDREDAGEEFGDEDDNDDDD